MGSSFKSWPGLQLKRNAPTGSGLMGAMPPRPPGPYQVGSRPVEVSKLSAIATSPPTPVTAGGVAGGGTRVGGGVTDTELPALLSGAVAVGDPWVPQPAAMPRL